jgi:hypothetical protein
MFPKESNAGKQTGLVESALSEVRKRGQVKIFGGRLYVANKA